MDEAGIPVVVVAAASSSSGRAVGDRNMTTSLVCFQSCISVVVYGLGPERSVLVCHLLLVIANAVREDTWTNVKKTETNSVVSLTEQLLVSEASSSRQSWLVSTSGRTRRTSAR